MAKKKIPPKVDALENNFDERPIKQPITKNKKPNVTSRQAVPKMPPKPVEHSPPPPPVVNRYSSMAVDFTEEMLDDEIENMTRDVVLGLVREQKEMHRKRQIFILEDIFETTMKEMMREIAQEEITYHKKLVNKIQNIEIKKVAIERIMNDMMLDMMLNVVAGKNGENGDDVDKILDGMALDVLLNVHSDVRKTKSKTLNNYPLKKFHMNTFMNVALDMLISELSSSLEDDMKELDLFEKKKINF